MIIFENAGLIDLRAIQTFGLHAKPNSTNPHGMFGTGLKMSIALFLRTGHTVSLYRGLELYRFTSTKGDFRGEEVNEVIMTGPSGSIPLPFATHLARNWEPWMGFRELYSNAVDEGGCIYRLESFQNYVPEPDKTAFLVKGDGVEEAYSKRDEVFLQTRPLFEAPCISVHPGKSNYGYYRGVRVTKLSHPSLFTYNLTARQNLTEDRTLDEGSFLSNVSLFASSSTDRNFLTHFITAPDNSFEHNIAAFWAFSPGTDFIAAYTDIVCVGRIIEISPFARAIYEKSGRAKVLPDPITPTPIQQKQLDRAIAFCLKMGWKVDEFPIIVVPHATEGLLALAEDGKIVLTAGVFDKGTKVVAHALYEEWLHLKLNMVDCSRELQTHLFQQVIGMGEQLIGEPL